MTTQKITTPAFLEICTEDGDTVHRSFDAVAASAALQARLLPRDRTHFEVARARLSGEFKTAEDVVLTLDQWWAMMRSARKRGITMSRVRVQA